MIGWCVAAGAAVAQVRMSFVDTWQRSLQDRVACIASGAFAGAALGAAGCLLYQSFSSFHACAQASSPEAMAVHCAAGVAYAFPFVPYVAIGLNLNRFFAMR